MDVEELLLVDQILADMVEAEEDVLVGREVLPRRDPFLLSDEKFIKLFRLTKLLAGELIEMLTPYLQAPNRRRSALSVKTKILATLRFLGYGSYQEITGSNHYVGVSQPSISRCIHEVCEALISPPIFNQWVHFPRTMEEVEDLRQSFYEKHNFPGIIGCVDCTHIAIIAPSDGNEQYPEHVYVNRKNYHSLNVQLICDTNLKITNVNARFPGSVHDSYIWGQSAVSETMENIYRQDPTNIFFLLGDSGYPTRPWLLTPIPNAQPGSGEDRFNESLCSVRSTIERCNGVLKNRFRCLLRHRVLHYSPTKAAQIVNACVVLHNMCIAHGIPEPKENDLEVPDYGISAQQQIPNEDPLNRVNPDLAAARSLQSRIINNHFR